MAPSGKGLGSVVGEVIVSEDLSKVKTDVVDAIETTAKYYIKDRKR